MREADPGETAVRAAAPRRQPRPPAALVLLVCGIAVLMLVPVGFVVWVGFDAGWNTLAPLIFRPKVGELLTNTVLLVAIGVPACIVLGVGGAWVVERTELPGRRVWAVILAAPLAVPAFVSSYGWVSAVPAIGGLGGGLLIAVLAYFPLVYLPALAAIRGLDPALEESARALGLGPYATFARVVLPQLRLAIWGGALIVALHLLAEYGAFALIRFDTFTTAIMTQYQSTFAGPAANALGVVLALICLVLLVSEATSRGRRQYARIGSGAARPAVRVALGWRTWPVLAILVAVVVLALVVPGGSLVHWLSFGNSWAQPDLAFAFLQTMGLSIGGAIVATIVAIPVAWLSVRHAGKVARFLEGGMYIASSLPTIIVALALVTVTLRLVPALYQTPATVIAAYVIVFLPRALVSLRSGLAQVPIRLEEAARSLGSSGTRTKLRVTLPLMAPSLGAAASLVLLGCANELTVTLLLAPSGTRTLATQFWSASSSVAYSAAAPYAVLLIALSIPSVAILFVHARKKPTG
ncbi:MAG: iron(III) transport system permease protein [Microbacteriaceae bacterium]|nr:iron(III) transport system permease protein [Microbacteriaceae bacterium]